jgi:signal transduction histidine kinase
MPSTITRAAAWRTPVSGTSCAAAPLDPRRARRRRAGRAGHRAGTLLTDVLTLAQLDAGALVARPVRLDVSHAAREAVAAFQASGGTAVTVMAPDETSGLADPAHLQLILGNLLANATKYGQPPVTVTVTNRRDHVAIQVADNGEGVPETFVPQLFDRFARAASGIATTTAGTGLGLYLVRQLAHAGGLDVAYQPNQPRGALFTVTVPCPAAHPYLRPHREQKPAHRPLDRP